MGTTAPLAAVPAGRETADGSALFDQAAEQACLGAALLSSEAAILVAGALPAADFYWESHRRIHGAIVTLIERGAGVDLLTVAAEIERTVGFEKIRGRDYLHVLVETVPTVAHARDYVARVQELGRQRRMAGALRAALGGLGVGGEGTVDFAVVREELSTAQQLLGESNHGPSRPVPVFDGQQLAAMDLSEPEAICEGLIYRGCSSDLIAEVKRGKTTFVLDMVRAILAGERFCEKESSATAVLYLSEQSPHSFAPQCARAGLLGSREFHVIFHRDALALDWPAVGELVLELADKRSIGLVIIDNVSLWAGIEGSEENDAGVALETLRVIERLTGAGLAVLGIRHARKGGGSINEAGRGSSAIAGGFDILLHLKSEKNPRRRLLEATGRIFAEEPPELLIEFGDDHRYRFVGEGRTSAADEAEKLILELLPADREQAMTEADILKACREGGIGKTSTEAVLRALSDGDDPQRSVERARGAGNASKQAYGYWRRTDV